MNEREMQAAVDQLVKDMLDKGLRKQAAIDMERAQNQSF